MSLLSILLMSCSACTSCASLPIDNNNNDTDTDDKEDTGEDTGDTARDTAPPPPCPVMEEEDNGDFNNAMPVPMETWIFTGHGFIQPLSDFHPHHIECGGDVDPVSRPFRIKTQRVRGDAPHVK